MSNFNYSKQQGAVLFVALIMLLVITILGISSLRGVTLESRVTANRQVSQDIINAADAAVREGEFRFYGLGYVKEKLEPNVDNCTDANKIKSYNKPCLLAIKPESKDSEDINLKKYIQHPLKLTADLLTFKPENIWMKYIGLDKNSITEVKKGFNAGWNSIRISTGEESNETINPEYGSIAEGKGTYYFLVNGKAGVQTDSSNEIAVQSTIANIFDGINN